MARALGDEGEDDEAEVARLEEAPAVAAAVPPAPVPTLGTGRMRTVAVEAAAAGVDGAAVEMGEHAGFPYLFRYIDIYIEKRGAVCKGKRQRLVLGPACLI